MAEFKEELIINALHPEKAEIGKKYWFADTLRGLKEKVEGGSGDITDTLKMIDYTRGHYFIDKKNISWEFLYPYDPSKQRMTRGQLMEWLSKGFGLMKYRVGLCYIATGCLEKDLNEECAEDILIRPWDSDEWIEPTVDIYERDCKGGKE